MPESFVNLYTLLNKPLKHTEYEIKEHRYTPEESLFLMFAMNFIKLANGEANNSNPVCSRSKDDLDRLSTLDYMTIKRHEISRTIEEYGLSVDPAAYKSVTKWNRPQLFKGIVKINDNRIKIETKDDEISVFVIKDEYRFNQHQQGHQITIPLSKLKGFRGQFRVQLDKNRDQEYENSAQEYENSVQEYKNSAQLDKNSDQEDQNSAQLDKNTAQLDKKEIEIQYLRTESDALIHFIRSTLSLEIESLLDIILLFNIDVIEFLKTRIRLFINGECSSSVILKDMSFISKYKLDVDLISDLIDYLLDAISRCECDILAYELYCYISFYLSIKRHKNNAFSTNDNTIAGIKSLDLNPIAATDVKLSGLNPITIMDVELSYKIVKNMTDIIKEASNRKNVSKDDEDSVEIGFIRLHQMFRSYMRMNIPINPAYIKTILDCFVNIDSSLKYFVMTDLYSRSCLNVDLFDVKKALNKTWGLFCDDLNKVLKNQEYKNDNLISKIELSDSCANKRYEAIDTLYNMLYKMMYDMLSRSKVKDVMKLYDEISEIHLKRISKSSDVEDLKVIHSSVIKLEKLFGYRNPKVESKLKKRALEHV